MTTSVNFTTSNVNNVFPLEIQFIDTSTTTDLITSWAWAFDIIDTSAFQNPTYTFATAGTYSVELTIQTLSEGPFTITKNIIASIVSDELVLEPSQNAERVRISATVTPLNVLVGSTTHTWPLGTFIEVATLPSNTQIISFVGDTGVTVNELSGSNKMATGGRARVCHVTAGVWDLEISSSQSTGNFFRTDYYDPLAKGAAWTHDSEILQEDGNTRIRGVNNLLIPDPCLAPDTTYMLCDVWANLGSGFDWQLAWEIYKDVDYCSGIDTIKLKVPHLYSDDITGNTITVIDASITTINENLTDLNNLAYVLSNDFFNTTTHPNARKLTAGGGITISTATPEIILISGLDPTVANTFTKSQTSAMVNLATVTGTVTLDASAGNVQRMILDGNITMAAPINALSGQNLGLHIIQDGTVGGRTITWDAVFLWQGGVKPVLSTGIGARDFIAMTYDSVDLVWIASLSVKGAAP